MPKGSLEEALFVILRGIPAKIKRTTKILEKMTLKERDASKALSVFNKNVTKFEDRFASKSDFNFLVCSGAAGIGIHSICL
jgi:hypothetical protein